MKKFLLMLAVAVLSLTAALTANSGIAATSKVKSHRGPARLTIGVLHMYNQVVYGQPIKSKVDHLTMGPIWDTWNDLDPYTGSYKPVRPGSGKTLVIDGHDVTPVPGYGAHGPFYRLYLIKPGDLATIRWMGVKYTYRFVTHPFARRQCASKRANDSAAHLNGTLICAPFNRPIYHWHWKAQNLYIRCCWPRGTRHDYLYARAVLIRTQPVS